VSERRSRSLALVAIALLACWFLWPPGSVGALAAAPLAILLVTGLRRTRFWGIAAAGAMLPYFSWGVMRVVTEPDARVTATAFTVLTIAAFLAALDSMRRL